MELLLIFQRAVFEIKLPCFKASNSLAGIESTLEDVYVRGGRVKHTLHLPQMKVFLLGCCETTCPVVFTTAFLQTGDGDLQHLREVSEFPLKSVRMIPESRH